VHSRDYDPQQDRDSVRRIFREVGWLEKGKEDAFDAMLAWGRTLVGQIGEEAECVVGTAPGVMRYLDQDLPFVEVDTVATSRIARRQGMAKRLLARALAADAADGALLARVCAFDQGFYDQVGFGPGGYEHTFSFDPASLRVAVKARVPRRLTAADRDLIYASRVARMRGHGAVNYFSPASIDMDWADRGFGLGYCDSPNGELTHHLCCAYQNPEHGPYNMMWMAYQTPEQFLELLALVKGLSDQVSLVRMREPQGIQLQDLLERPLRHHRVTRKSDFENQMTAYAYWQIRVLDLPRCLSSTHLPWGETRFNLHLTDPIEKLLDTDSGWRGTAGDYVITLGPNSSAEPGADPSLPTLTASVNAFSRLWLGVRPATGLSVTDNLSGPPSLLSQLDQCLRLPEPKPDWDF